MNRKKSIAVFAILFCLFNVSAFLIPFVMLPSFWVAFGFTDLSLLMMLLICGIAFQKTTTLKSKVFGFYVFRIGYIYAAVQIIVGYIFMAFSVTPVWITTLICIVLLAITGVSVLLVDTGRNVIEKIDDKTAEKVYFIKSMQIDVDALKNAENDETVNEKLKELSDKVRYSDPMSSAQLRGIESEITAKIAQLKGDVIIHDSGNAVINIDETISLLDERNQKCRLLK